MKTLSKRTIRAFAKEERATARRYRSLGKRYGLKGLIKAGRDEKRHARYFKNLKKVRK